MIIEQVLVYGDVFIREWRSRRRGIRDEHDRAVRLHQEWYGKGPDKHRVGKRGARVGKPWRESENGEHESANVWRESENGGA